MGSGGGGGGGVVVGRGRDHSLPRRVCCGLGVVIVVLGLREMTLTLLELLGSAGQVEDGAARVDVESSWCTAVRRLNPSMATPSEPPSKKGVAKKPHGVADTYFEDLMMRESGAWQMRCPNAEEDRVVAELKKKLGNLGDFSKEEFVAMTRPVLESAARADGNAEGAKASGRDDEAMEVADAEFSYLRVLRKVGPHIGRKLLASIVRCSLGLQFWGALKVLLELGLVTSASHPDLVQKLVEHRKADFLCLCFYHVLDLTPSDLMIGLKFLLEITPASGRSFEVVRQGWRRAACDAIDLAARRKENVRMSEYRLRDALGIVPAEGEGASGAAAASEREKRKYEKLVSRKNVAVAYAVAMAVAVDGFEGWETCLHALVASGQDEAVLAAIVAELDTSEAVQLLQYVRKWLDRYSGRLCSNPLPRGESMDSIYRVPSSQQVLQWVSMVLDGQYTKCVLSPKFLPELRAIQGSVQSVVAIGRKLTPLLGVVEHLRAMHALPARGQDSVANADYTIEYLDIS